MKYIKARTSHGMSGTRTYKIWGDLFSRCYNHKSTSYKYYGAKGVKVCERWSKFINFYEDMGERPEGKQIDRIDSKGDYCPENCRWATSKENNPYNKGDIKDVMLGNKFGEWLVLYKVNRKSENRHYLCECSCGYHAIISGTALRLKRSIKCRKCSRTSPYPTHGFNHGRK